jgi:hypothetical protein
MIDESRLRRMDKRISDLKAALQKGDTDNQTPTGVILPYGGSSAPNGYLMCVG